MQVSLQSDRDRLNQELVEARSDLKIVIAAREQESIVVNNVFPNRPGRCSRWVLN
jgi:hypothetical protein